MVQQNSSVASFYGPVRRQHSSQIRRSSQQGPGMPATEFLEDLDLSSDEYDGSVHDRSQSVVYDGSLNARVRAGMHTYSYSICANSSNL